VEPLLARTCAGGYAGGCCTTYAVGVCWPVHQLEICSGGKVQQLAGRLDMLHGGCAQAWSQCDQLRLRVRSCNAAAVEVVIIFAFGALMVDCGVFPRTGMQSICRVMRVMIYYEISPCSGGCKSLSFAQWASNLSATAMPLPRRHQVEELHHTHWSYIRACHNTCVTTSRLF
jgi:hypothetical protein